MPAGGVSWRTGLALVSGVPALVFVSIAPVAALSGKASTLVWCVSATVGLILALAYSELPRRFPHANGGLGVLGAYALAPFGYWAASLTRWSYWLGWSPGLGVYSALVANYIAGSVAGHDSFAAWVCALMVIAATTALNYHGWSRIFAVQVPLSVTMVAVIVIVAGWPLVSGQVHLDNLFPLTPDGGWTGPGFAAVCGSLFIAGWTCYGGELAMALTGEYRRGANDAVRCLVGISVATMVVYALVPAVIIGSLGPAVVQRDPADILAALVPRPFGGVDKLLVGAAIVVPLVLSVNMITATSARLLCQIGRDDAAFAWLARQNAHGMPSSALFFDGGVNIVLVTIAFVLSRGQSLEVPLFLLCAANICYFVAVIMSLVGVLVLRPCDAHRRKICCSAPVVGGAIAFNLLLLASAGYAWGWTPVAMGSGALITLLAGTAAVRRCRSADAISHGSARSASAQVIP
jgi:amino acid transporter